MISIEMFEGFDLRFVELPGARLRVRIGGQGSPILLLHGHPRTHTTWHRVAPSLARSHTVVCPDLRGFGRSSQPIDTSDHIHSSKRTKANDCVALMRTLGYESFAIAGHDRGCYTAFRCAMDHPEAVTEAAMLDAVPILEALERTTEHFAKTWWHWFFFGEAEKPERAINADPDLWYTGTPEAMGQENYDDFRAAVRDPSVVHGMVEDYRAGLGIDRAHDAADRAAGRKLHCPTLVLWSLRDDIVELYGDPLAIWRNWATDVTGFGIDSGHHMSEEAPEALASALLGFLQSARRPV